MSRFVQPETAVLTLGNGDTLIVKHRLNTGETRRMFAAMRRDIVTGEEREIVTKGNHDAATVAAYLLDWSLTDNGRPVVIRDQPPDVVRAAVEQLDYESYTEIAAAITAHVARQDAARAEEKKTQNTGTGSPPISPLPPVLVGVTNG